VSIARPGGGQSFSSGGSRSSGSSGSRSSGGSSFSSGGSRSSGSSGSRGTTFSSGSSGSRSSGSSSSSSDGGGGAGAAIFFIIMLVLVVGVVGILWLVAANSRRTRKGILEAQYQRQQAAPPQKVSLDVLRSRDPQLTEQSILDRVGHMSVILRDAWCGGNMNAARPFVSDGIFSRFQVQLELMRAEGVRNVMSDAQILYITLEAVDSKPPIDVVHVRFTAKAKDVTVPLQSTPQDIGQALSRATAEPYTEIWTLVRKQGAVTRLPPDQVGKSCPQCGAPLDPQAEMIKCQQCGALVCSAEHDWVLSEITQLSEWYPESHGEVPGLPALRETDPVIAREVLEDRASYLFWKWIESARKRSPQPVRKCATEAFIRGGGGGVGGLAQVSDVAVGAADCFLCDPGPEGDFDHVYVKLYWSGRMAPGQPPTPCENIARLSRRAGVHTKFSMTSVICQNCGALLKESDNTKCDHCNTELAAGQQNWVLDAILPPGSVQPRGGVQEQALPDWLVPDIADPRERGVLFAQMGALMARDGNFGKREKKLMRLCARRWAIPDEKVAHVMSNPLASSNATITSASPQWFLSGLVAAALIDGKLDTQERAMLERARGALSLPPEELERQIAQTKQRLGLPA
jgi:hypothetical protein